MRATLAFAGLIIAAAMWPGVARADEKDACADAYESGQRLQRAGSLRAARAQYLTCARDSCAPFVRADCTKWLAEIDAAMPAVTIVVKRCEEAICKDAIDALVSIDGTVTDVRSGLAVPLDPGPHVIDATAPGVAGGHASFVTHEGERKVVELRLEAPPPTSAPPAPRREIPTATWILGGVGLAALASFGTFAILGRSQQSSTLAECRGGCAHDDVASVRTKYIVADLSLAVSAIALGASAYFYLTSKRSPVTAGRGDVRTW